MRGRWVCVPMMTLCLLLGGCGGTAEESGGGEAARRPYQRMESCAMTADVSCTYGESVWEFTLKCDYTPEKSTVEVLAPETAAGVKAILAGDALTLEYEDDCLPAGTLSDEKISPAACLPRLMSALRDGWLLEENQEDWGDTPCLRLCLDQTGANGNKILSTLWLRQEGNIPVRGEIAVDGEIILQAQFTDFEFGAILDETGGAASG